MAKQFVVIQLDKPRNLRLSFKALIIIESLLKTNIAKIDFNSLSLNDMAIMLYAGLKHEDPAITPDVVIDLIDEYSDIKEVAEKLGEAITESFGKNVEAVAVTDQEKKALANHLQLCMTKTEE